MDTNKPINNTLMGRCLKLFLCWNNQIHLPLEHLQSRRQT
jgi:hypothetical protein